MQTQGNWANRYKRQTISVFLTLTSELTPHQILVTIQTMIRHES